MEARITSTHSSNGHVTEFANTPFSLLERNTLDCQFGKQYYKDRPRKSSRAMVQGTRKLGCPSHVHAGIDTNNGTEAQNKLLKYSYMPKQKTMTLSEIVCILVD